MVQSKLYTYPLELPLQRTSKPRPKPQITIVSTLASHSRPAQAFPPPPQYATLTPQDPAISQTQRNSPWYDTCTSQLQNLCNIRPIGDSPASTLRKIVDLETLDIFPRVGEFGIDDACTELTFIVEVLMDYAGCVGDSLVLNAVGFRGG